MSNIAVLVSGGGTNLQALIDAEAAGQLGGGTICCVISSNPDAHALLRAMGAGIPSVVVDRSEYDDKDAFTRALLLKLWEYETDLVVLAGFMCLLGEELCRIFENRMMNVHPSLIPAFCGDGFFGMRVHRAVLEFGAKVTGATVHFVNAYTDGGPVILQKAINIHPDDTPETLQLRVMKQCEWDILPRAVRFFCEGRITVEGRRVLIDDTQDPPERPY